MILDGVCRIFEVIHRIFGGDVGYLEGYVGYLSEFHYTQSLFRRMKTALGPLNVCYAVVAD